MSAIISKLFLRYRTKKCLQNCSRPIKKKRTTYFIDSCFLLFIMYVNDRVEGFFCFGIVRMFLYRKLFRYRSNYFMIFDITSIDNKKTHSESERQNVKKNTFIKSTITMPNNCSLQYKCRFTCVCKVSFRNSCRWRCILRCRTSCCR